jgi:hypothetical protein
MTVSSGSCIGQACTEAAGFGLPNSCRQQACCVISIGRSRQPARIGGYAILGANIGSNEAEDSGLMGGVKRDGGAGAVPWR